MSDMTGGRARQEQLRVRLEQERSVEVSRLDELHAPGPQRSSAPGSSSRRGVPTQGPRSRFGPSMVRGEQRLAHLAWALAHLDDDTFGRCQACGSLIDDERLAQQPLSDHCWRCAAP